jgi:tRNA(Ile)-lysidine synthase
LHQLIRSWLAEQGISSPSHTILQKLKAELLSAKVDASPILQWSKWQFRRFDGRLFVISVESSIPAHTLLWQGQKQLNLPAPLGVLRTQTKAQPDEQNILLAPHLGEIKLHFGGYAQRFKPIDGACSKPLKQWYKEWKIPPWQRDKIMLLTQNEQSLALLLDGKWLLSQYYGAQQASLTPAKTIYLQYQVNQ